MCLLIEFSALRLASVVQVGLVVEPGVLTMSGSLIKLQGVDSLVLLLQIITIDKIKKVTLMRQYKMQNINNNGTF